MLTNTQELKLVVKNMRKHVFLVSKEHARNLRLVCRLFKTERKEGGKEEEKGEKAMI